MSIIDANVANLQKLDPSKDYFYGNTGPVLLYRKKLYRAYIYNARDGYCIKLADAPEYATAFWVKPEKIEFIDN